MDWATAIIGILKILPDMLNLGKELMVWLNHASGNDPQGYVKKVGAAMAQLNNAKTQQERQDAAKAIAGAISGLP